MNMNIPSIYEIGDTVADMLGRAEIAVASAGSEEDRERLRLAAMDELARLDIEMLARKVQLKYDNTAADIEAAEQTCRDVVKETAEEIIRGYLRTRFEDRPFAGSIDVIIHPR